MTLLMENEYFSIVNITDHQHWLHERTKGIGGSDAGIICGQSMYKTPYELWEEKTGLREAPFVTSAAIELGNALEPVMFDMFAKSQEDYVTVDTKNISLVSKKYPFMRANLDGALIDKGGIYGGLEIKTTTIHHPNMLTDWKDQVPQTYYCQILHYFIVTGFRYFILYAWIRIPYLNKVELRQYYFSSYDEQIQADMEYLLETEKDFWDHVEKRQKPKFLNKEILI